MPLMTDIPHHLYSSSITAPTTPPHHRYFDSTPNYTRWFYLLLIMHVVLWTLVPTILRHTLPMDALEGFVWGQKWQLGYDRNPWLNAWLTHIAVLIGGKSGWLVYLFSQLSVAACFLSIWSLGRKFLPPLQTLIAVFILEGLQYYTIAAVDFNDNVLELGLWTASIIFFYNALVQQKWHSWVLTSVCAALSLMTKYYAVVLFVPMCIVLLATHNGRTSFKYAGLYLGAFVFLLIVAPHFFWLMHNNFVTLNYALMRTTDTYLKEASAWYFAGTHLLAFAAPLLLFALVWQKNKRGHHLNIFIPSNIDAFTQFFLIILGVGPFLITVFLSAIWRISLHVMWGTPLLSLWGLLLVILVQPKHFIITTNSFYRFICAILIVFFGALGIYSYNLVYVGYESSATYPGEAIATYAANAWRTHNKPLTNKLSTSVSNLPYYVVGDRYTAGNVAYFATHKMIACIYDDQIYTCDSDADIRTKGAIFVWRNGNNGKPTSEATSFIAKIKQRFPEVSVFATQSFRWIYHPSSPNLYVGFAFLFPQHNF